MVNRTTFYRACDAITDFDTLRDIKQDEMHTAIREDRPEPTDEQIEAMLERCYEIETSRKKGNR